MSELLSISIPTRNRALYLQVLLHSIAGQIESDQEILKEMKIYIFDNASSDQTEEVIRQSNLPIIYQRNTENIGIDPNLEQAYTAVTGKYVWVIGDDEILTANSLHLVLQLLKEYNPSLIIGRCARFYPSFTEPWIFPNYLSFAQYVKRVEPAQLIAHSLISYNILLKKCFDVKFALEKRDTKYGYFYGMVKGLMAFPGPVLFPIENIVIVRAQRAPRVDAISQMNISSNPLWAKYNEWITKEYGLDKQV
jgi:glycosyltransferase involved in cell wall biosynthesis